MAPPSRTLLLALAALAAAGCRASSREPARASYPALESGSFGSMRNVSVSEEIWFGGAPAESDLELARRRGVHTVIDLSTPDERTALDVPAACAELGLEYHAPALSSEDMLDAPAVDEVLALLESEDRPPTLLFCGSGSRCATVLAIYRASRVGVPLPAALAEARRAGMRPQDEEFVVDQVGRLTGGAPRAGAEDPEGAPDVEAPDA